MRALGEAVRSSGLPHELIDLLDYRVSQMNGCAFCLDMIVAINVWNRLNVAFRTPAGNYKSAVQRSAA